MSVEWPFESIKFFSIFDFIQTFLLVPNIKDFDAISRKRSKSFMIKGVKFDSYYLLLMVIIKYCFIYLLSCIKYFHLLFTSINQFKLTLREPVKTANVIMNPLKHWEGLQYNFFPFLLFQHTNRFKVVPNVRILTLYQPIIVWVRVFIYIPDQ